MRRLPSTDDREAHDSRSRIVRLCAELADSAAFNLFIFAVILANAAVLGLETYDGVVRRYGDVLHTLNNVFLGIFLVELAIRLTAFGKRPAEFFHSGWNVSTSSSSSRRSHRGCARTRRSCGSLAWAASCGSCACCPTCAC
jgi:hypothetical protein